MAIVRQELDVDVTKRRFPAKATCLAIYSRVVKAEAALSDVLEQAYPWCVPWEAELKRLFASYVRAKQAQNVLDYDDLLLYWAHMAAEPSLSRQIGERLRPRPRRRVSGHQSAAGVDPPCAQAGRQRHDRRRRRCAVDLFVSRRDRAQHPRLPRSVHAARAGRDARSQLPLDAADSRRFECRDRFRPRAIHEEPVDRAPVFGEAAPRDGARRKRPGAMRGRASARTSRRGHGAAFAGGAVPQLEPQRAIGDRARAARHPVRQVRRTQVSRGVAREGCPGGGEVGGQSAQPHGRLPRGESRPGDRHRDGQQAPRPARRYTGRIARARSVQGGAVCNARLENVPRAFLRPPFDDHRLAGGARFRHAMVRAAARAPVRRRGGSPARPRPAARDRRHVSRRASAS